MTSTDLEKPIVALSVALAGKREIARGLRSELTADLQLVFRQLEAALAAVHADAARGRPLSLRFDDGRAARLTLVTGLADGADQLASEVFLSAQGRGPAVEKSLGAVLPCPRTEFVHNSPVEDRETFDRLAERCDFVIELDGGLPGANEGPPPARHEAVRQRAAAFHAQSEFLLRLGDLLIAVDDLAGHSQVGGTRQTIRAAVEFGLPVILVRLGEPGFAILRTRLDIDEPLQLQGQHAAAAVDELVAQLLGRPSAPADAYVEALFQEFYGADARPGALNLEPLLSAAWSAFERRLTRRRQPVSSSGGSAPYMTYRRRASLLSRRYAGLYRGSFLVGYALAVAAVTLAALSLLALVLAGAGAMPETAGLAVLGWLGILKLLAVAGMAWLAKQAHVRRLSHRAADYRYLSERLRTMTFLPYAGSLRPPAHLSQPYTTRVTTQGAIDQLFYSIVRAVEPSAAFGAPDERRISLSAAQGMAVVGHEWVSVQRRYHQDNAAGLARMSERLETWGRRLNNVIVGIVLIDLALVALDLLHLLPASVAGLLREGLEPVLIAVAAILPAAVASLNGVRFQSEVARLADRSEQMGYELLGVEDRAGAMAARGARLADVLHVAEDAARLTLDEVSEWTAIYGKEFVEM
jgi:hypothetical protein